MHTEKITNKIKKTLKGFDKKKMHEHMFKHYMLLHLIDERGKWVMPEFQKISSELLPSDMTEQKSMAFVDEMAGLVEKNFYLTTFLEQIKNVQFEQLFKKVKIEGDKVIPDVIAYAYVLECLTKAAYNDMRILKKCVQIFKEERKKISPFRHETLFRKIKLELIEKPIMENILLKSYQTGIVSKSAGATIVSVNIWEAIIADVVEWNVDNASVGRVLAEHRPGLKEYDSLTEGGPSEWSKDKKAVNMRPPLPREWADLYQTWNMAFVSQAQNYPYIIPKLFIPQVANYQDNPEQYLHKRVIALYLCLNYLIFDCAKRMEENKPKLQWDDDELTRLWGISNLKSAEQYKLALLKNV